PSITWFTGEPGKCIRIHVCSSTTDRIENPRSTSTPSNRGVTACCSSLIPIGIDRTRSGDSRRQGLLLLLLIPRFDLEPDRAPDKSEVLANLVPQKSLKRKVHLDVLIGKQHKRRRSDRRLRHVINPHALIHRHGSLLEVHLLQKPVHLPSGHALPPLPRHQLHFLEHLFDVLSIGSRDKQQRRIVQVLQLIANLLLVELLVSRRLAVKQSHPILADP